MTPVRTRTRLATLTLLATLAGGVSAPAWADATPTAPQLVPGTSADLLAPAGSRAAQVRSTLTAEFQAHDALAALTQSAYLRFGAVQGKAAAAVLAQTRQALAAGVGGLTPQAAAFRDALAASDSAKLAYAQGLDRYHGSPARAATAQRAVTAAGTRVASTLSALLPDVPRATVTALLTQQDARDAAATKALAARSPEVYTLVENAHLGTAGLSRAAAVSLDARQQLAGSATSPAAELRARTVLLSQAHVVQTGLASDAGLTYGLGSSQYRAAAAALATNTQQFTAAVRELSGAANAAAFNAQWNRHIGDYVTFVRGLQQGNAGLRTAAATDLGGFVRSNAVQLSRVSGLTAAALVPSLTIHTSGTLVVIRLQAEKSTKQWSEAAMGTMHFAVVGDRLAAAAAARLGLAD